MNRKRLLPVAIVLGAVVIATVMIQMRPEPPRVPPPSLVPVVTTVPPEERSGEIEVVGSGTVRPRAEIDLAPQVAGQVLFVSPALVSGGRVAAGQTLVRIDPSDYENAVSQVRAEVAQQEVGLLQAEEEAAIAAAEFERFRARQIRLGLPEPTGPSPLTLREPQLAAARAALERAEAQLGDAELALARTEVTAPFDAIVRSESVDVGSFVSPGQSVARLYASDEVEVVIPLTDEDASLIPELWSLRAGDGSRRVGASVRAVYGGSSFAWQGYVDRAEAVLDEQSRTVRVVVRVPSPFSAGRPVESDPTSRGASRPGDAAVAPPLLVGQYVQVRIAGMALDAYTVIPRSALRPGDEVWTVEADSLLRVVPVRVLQRADDEVSVVGELGGRPVVTGGIQIGTDGMRVRSAQIGR